MRWISVLLLAGLAAIPARAQMVGPVTPIGATNVADFLKGCSVDRNGCQLAVSSALIDKIDVGAGPAQICAPTGADLGTPVAAWLRQHPEAQTLPTEDAIFQAMAALYPCGQPGSKP